VHVPRRLRLPGEAGGTLVRPAVPAAARPGRLPRRLHHALCADRGDENGLDGVPEEVPAGVDGHREDPARVPEVRESGTFPEAGRVVERVHLPGVPSPSGRGDLPDGAARREGQPAPCVGQWTLHVTWGARLALAEAEGEPDRPECRPRARFGSSVLRLVAATQWLPRQ